MRQGNGKGPVGIGYRRAQSGAHIVSDRDRRVGFCGTGEDCPGGVNRQTGGGRRRRTVNGKFKGGGDGAQVARFIGFRQGDAVQSILHGDGRGVTPGPVGGNLHFRHQQTIVIDGNDAARIARATQFGLVIIGKATVSQQAL